MVSKKTSPSTTESYEIEGHPWSLTETPWGTEADYAHRVTGEPIEQCRDYVIMRYLMEGDTRPLAALFSLGHAPGTMVLDYVAGMLHPADGTETEIEYILKPKRRNGKPGPLPSPETKWTGLLTTLNVLERTNDDGEYRNTVFYDVAKELPSGNKAYETVRAEYRKRRKLFDE